jgi:hypothetical protein
MRIVLPFASKKVTLRVSALLADRSASPDRYVLFTAVQNQKATFSMNAMMRLVSIRQAIVVGMNEQF